MTDTAAVLAAIERQRKQPNEAEYFQMVLRALEALVREREALLHYIASMPPSGKVEYLPKADWYASTRRDSESRLADFVAAVGK